MRECDPYDKVPVIRGKMLRMKIMGGRYKSKPKYPVVIEIF